MATKAQAEEPVEAAEEVVEPEKVWVLCILGRMVADDTYEQGQKYEIEVSRYEKYTDYFEITEPDPEPEADEPKKTVSSLLRRKARSKNG